jgi:hypothetical protein
MIYHGGNALRTVDSPRMRCAVRPSLRQAVKRVKIIYFNLMALAGIHYNPKRRLVYNTINN